MTDDAVPAAAIAAAMRAVEGLHARLPGDDLDREIALAIDFDIWGRGTLTHAVMLLIGVAFSVIKTPDDEPTLGHRIVGAAVNALRSLELPEVPDEVLPTLAGGLTAAAFGQDVHGWRASLGSIPDSETLPWTYACYVVVGFVDDYLGPGEFGQIVAQITEGRA